MAAPNDDVPQIVDEARFASASKILLLAGPLVLSQMGGPGML